MSRVEEKPVQEDGFCDDGMAVVCRGLVHGYGEKPVLKGIDLDVPARGMTALLGKNGAGKSTTINLLMGFLGTPRAGTCRVLGWPLGKMPAHVRQDIGLLHEGFIQFDYMTVEQIERFHAPFFPRWDASIYWDLVGRLDVPGNRVVARMSCGQRSQVALGLVLAQRPRFMILDDYSMGLDVGYRRLFLEILRDYTQRGEVGVLMTSHVVSELDGMVDNVVFLKSGEVVAAGSCSEVLGALKTWELPLCEQSLALPLDGTILGLERHPASVTVCTRAGLDELCFHLAAHGLENVEPKAVSMTLEDAFVGLTGRY